MQAVLLAVGDDGTEVDFWWIKPQAERQTDLELATLDRHSKGIHKNTAASSAAVYQPLADLFLNGSHGFGVRRTDDGVPRMVVQAHGIVMWVYLIWQEKWQSNPFSSTKFISGKIVYHKSPDSETERFFSRSYYFEAPQKMVISEVEDVEWAVSPMPDDCIKD